MVFGNVARGLVFASAAALAAAIVWPKLGDVVYPGGGDRVAGLRDYIPALISSHLPSYKSATQQAAAAKPPAAGGPPGRGGRGGPPGGRPPVSVITGQATRGAVPYVVETVGNVLPVATVSIKTRVDSYITRIVVADGAKVKADDILVQLDSRQMVAQVAQAEASLARNRALLEQAQRDVRRFTELLARNTGTKINLDNARTQVLTAQAQILSDQAQVENLKVQLSYFTIKAPISGRIGTISAKAGNIIRAGDNSATGILGTIVQTSPIYVSFSLPQNLLPELRASIAAGTGLVTVKPQGTERTATGKIALLENTIDSATGTITVRALFENADEFLWAGQLCSVRLVLRTDENVVSVPRDATQSGQNGNFVFVVDKGVAQVKQVTISRTQDGRDIITSGLTGEETVVVDGALSLVNGARVQVRNQPPKRDS